MTLLAKLKVITNGRPSGTEKTNIIKAAKKSAKNF